MNDDSTFIDLTRQHQIFVTRVIIACIVAIVMGIVIVARYFDLQITRHQDFVTQADNNRVHMRPASPSRGLIYDRNGNLLADNRPTYNLTIVRERSQDMEQLLVDLNGLIDISDNDITQFKKRLKRRKPYENTALKYNLSERERSILAVNSFRLAGAEVSARLTRHYPSGELFAHVIGYVGRINEEESQTIDTIRYSGTDSIGKIGIEKHYEDSLLGQVGNEHVETSARGRVMRVLSKVDPLAGDSLTLHLDRRLQATAHAALEDHRAALVAIEVKSGGILAMVSTPSYDPNLFVSGISQVNYSALVQSEDRPLFNRAIRGQYPPGSTIKPIFGLIGLQNEDISAEHTIDDPGYFYMDGVERPWRDHNSKRGGHGKNVDLAEAIIESCDVYFYTMSVDTGIDVLADYSQQFGLGRITGLDIPGEQSGIMPSKEWKRQARGQPWFNGDTINASIGQGFMLATPLQLAVMSARLASRGKVLEPRLVKARNGVEKPPTEQSAVIDIDSEHWDYMHRAMRDVVHSPRGTANRIRKDIGYNMAGKTGTAQVISISADDEYDRDKINQRQWDHALFIAFAPVEDPQIAIGLIVENGEHGSSTAAPVARLVIDEFMKNQPDQQLGQR